MHTLKGQKETILKYLGNSQRTKGAKETQGRMHIAALLGEE